LEQGSEKSETRRRVAVVIPVSYAALREATRERERKGRQTRGGRCTLEVLGEAVEEGLVEIVFY
jgi:hypothetical protein